jgi:site-specific DNA-cytosine methylase
MGNGAFRFIDLFAGIGGMRLGFEAVGGECVFTCDRAGARGHRHPMFAPVIVKLHISAQTSYAVCLCELATRD